MSVSNRVFLFALAAGASLLPAASFAQPVSVDPAQVERRFDRETAAPLPGQPAPLPAVEAAAPAADVTQRFGFVLRNVTLKGNHAIATSSLEKAYQPFIGKRLDRAAAQKIQRAIVSAYRAEGFVLAQAALKPAANRSSLDIVINEGAISQVRFASGQPQNATILAYANKLTATRPVRNTDIERFLLLLNDLPGVRASGAVTPSANLDGTAQLVVSLSERRFDGSYNVDNRGSKLIGPVQHSFAASANSLFDRSDRTTARFVTTSPTTELRFFDIYHQMPVGSEGGKVTATGSLSKTEPKSTLSASNITANSNYTQLGYTHPLLRERLKTLSVRGAVDARNTDVKTAGVVTSKDNIRTLRGGLNYEFSDGLNGANIIDVELSQGIKALGASEQRDDTSRSGADGDFSKINIDVSRTHYLPVAGLSLLTSATGQFASDRLLGAEQISFGGYGFGRGYNPAEIAGDHGLGGKVELRYNRATTLPVMPSYQVYSFLDAGRVWTRGNNSTDDSLSSVGLGVRAQIYQQVSTNIEIAQPLTKNVSNEGNHGDSPRVFLGATTRF
ncbi:MAG: ShlB/FhaC/HecB family hemolysin secretion/activation protein [Alphaproteobacteria bacterium]|nr:ShlB/FhaC/HecB family hemolysin secretion/activation protein [Alphaproteobacteria bacterium]